MNNRIIGIFESGNSLADKLDCYYFYNELRKYYNEGEQLDNNLWQVIFYFKNSIWT